MKIATNSWQILISLILNVRSFRDGGRKPVVPGSRKTLSDRLEKNSNSGTNDRAILDINGTNKMFPMEPLTIIGATKSGLPRRYAIQDFLSLHLQESNVVIQETSRRRLEPKADTETANYLAAKEKLAMEEKEK